MHISQEGQIFTRDWGREPIPSRDTPKDRKRVMEGDRLKRNAEERPGRELRDDRKDRDRREHRHGRDDDRYYGGRRRANVNTYDRGYDPWCRNRDRSRDRRD